MDDDKEDITRRYWKIGEVSRLLCIAPSNLRFWTDIFKIELKRTRKNNRLFNEHEIRTMLAIKYLIDKELYTVPGAIIKLRLWIKKKYDIPEEYLSIKNRQQTESLYDSIKATRNPKSRVAVNPEVRKVFPAMPSLPQLPSTS